MRAALYIRVSTEEQAKEGFSIAAQRQILEAYVKSQGWEIAGYYADEGFSGKNLKRPELQRLLEDVRAHRTDVVLVWQVDRLARRQIGVLRLLEEHFEPNGVGFRSVTQPFDTLSPAGKAMLGMLAVFAELELAMIIERTRIGQERRALDGLWSGRAPYGYRYDAGGALEPDPVTAPILQQIFRDVVDGWGLKRIASWLEDQKAPTPLGRGRWHAGSLSLIVRNRIYLGERRHRGAWIASQAPAILDEGIWLRAQAGISERLIGERPRRGQESPYLLTGLVYCGACGARMFGRTVMPRGKRPKRYYTCPNRPTAHPDTGPAWVRMEKLNQAVEEVILAGRIVIGQPEAVDVGALQSDAREVDKRIQRLVAAVEAGALPIGEVQRRMLELQAKRAEIEERLAEASVKKSEQADRRELQQALDRLPEEWAHLAHAEKQRVLRVFVRRVEVQADGTPRIIA